MLEFLIIWLRIVFNELAFWMVGLTPESYHGQAAYLWSRLDRYDKVLKHCRGYLRSSENSEIRAMLGYSLAYRGDWKAAAETYRGITDIWSAPHRVLCLAEAEMHSGNLEEAKKILVSLEVGHAQSDSALAQHVEQLKGELEELAGSPLSV